MENTLEGNGDQQESSLQPQEQKETSKLFGLNQSGAVIIVVAVIFVLAVVGILGYFLLGKNKPNTSIPGTNTNNQSVPSITQTSGTVHNDFFLFSIPKPISNISILNLPNTASIRNVIPFKDSLWFAGGGNLVEYDTKSDKLVSYSDMTKANCDGNVVMTNNFLFTSCHSDNVEDAFGHTEQLTSKIFTGHYSVYKINPSTHEVEHIFGDKDGLLNRYNYNLVSDGDTVWVQTFKGIGRIDAKTNAVSFYTTPQIDITFGIGKIIPDKDFVWAWSADKGLALFNKSTQSWQQFVDADILGRPAPYRLDARPFNNPVKLVSSGLQIGLWAGDNAQNNCLVRQYDYTTKQWTTVSQQQIQYVYQCEDLLKQQFPQEPTYTTVNSDGLVQILLPGTNKQYQIDGRNNYILSPLLNNKRYILTGSTIDVIDDSSAFRQILVKLGNLPSSGVSYGDSTAYEGLVSFFVDSSSLGVVVDPDCAGQGCKGGQKAWLIDLKAGKVNKVYTTKADNLPSGDSLYNLSMSREGNLLVIKDKNGKPLFNIDTTNYSLSLPQK